MSSRKKQSPDDSLEQIRARIRSVSGAPGVYRWLGEDGEVLYVGKAKHLKNRLLSYVQPGQKHTAWKEIMMRNVRDFDVTLTNSELEALVLETNLIKEMKPKYNIMMKDDKNYVYVRIALKEPYPRIDIVRRMEDDGALYFGPKTSAEDVRGSLTLLRKLFPFRTCKMTIEPKGMLRTDPISKIHIDVTTKNRDRSTPCLDYHIKQCCAPCVGYVTPEEYRRDAIDGVVAFFQGKHAGIVDLLQERMREAAAEKKFERAAEIRDQLQYIERLQEKQIISDTSRENADIFGMALRVTRAHIVLLKERDGRLVAEESFALTGNADTPAEVFDNFLPQYYASTTDLPDAIILSDAPSDAEILHEWLALQRGKNIRITVPQRGKKSHLLLLAEKNAQWKVQQGEAKWEAHGRTIEEALAGLASALELPSSPKRIEAYDISHLGGSFTVGSMVVCIDGKPRNDHYRSFSIRTLSDQQIDDYAALKEVLRRRLKYLMIDLNTEEAAWNTKGILIGKGKKAETETLQKMLGDHADLTPSDFLVARHEDDIIACARLKTHSKRVTEIASVWTDKKYASQKPAVFLVRKLLKKVKKGKVYAVINAASYDEYGELGFRHVHDEPSPFKETLEDLRKKNPDESLLLMMYETSKNKKDVSLSSAPDLLVIDGGKGQLGAVTAVLKEYGLMIPVIGLAKREEEIFMPGHSHPIALAKEAPAQFLLQRLRDEAHRFANELRKKQGKSATFHSAFDDIPGIGPKTRMMLFKTFGSLARAQAATDDELLALLTRTQLDALRAYGQEEEGTP